MPFSGENNVASQATAAVIETLEGWGRDVSSLAEGTGLDLATLRSSRDRIPWAAFARFLRNVRALVDSEAQLEELGHAIVHAPSWTLVRRVASMVVSPRQHFLLGVRVAAPSVFPAIESEVRELADGRFEVCLRIPEHLEPCPELFRISVGQLRGHPRFLRLPDALVEHEIAPRSARFVVTLPSSQSLLHKAFAVARSFTDAPAAYRDLVALRRELERQHASHARARQDMLRVLDSLPDGVGVHRDGTLVYVNPALARMLGYEREELIGRSGYEIVLARDHGAVAERMERRDPDPDRPMELRLRRRDGGTVIAAIEPGQTIEIAGEAARMVVVRDLTESRRLEGQLAHADRMASLGTLAAGVAHEINNPLAWLHTSLAVLKSELEALAAGESVHEGRLSRMTTSLEAALEGADRVRLIAKDLRTFSRPDDDSLEPVDVTEALRGAVRMCQKEIRARARLVEDYGEVPRVLGNGARLGQVFLNLLVNASQAIPEGAPDDHEIRVSTHAGPHGAVVVEVRDDGPGIPRHLLPRIFEPFFTTKQGEGTGLGLAISHRIVTSMGGQIAVESAPGEGTTFRVVLPEAQRDAMAAPRENEAR